MKKIRVNFILVLLIFAMIALVIIQAFQTSQLYDRTSSEFNEHFSMILDRIALRHEKAEDIRKYLQIANKDFGVKYKDILKEEFKNLLSVKESISIEDTAIFENGEMQNYLIIKGQTFDSISGVTAEQRVLARDVRQLRDLFSRKSNGPISQDSVQLAVQIDQRVIQQIFKKARFVNELMIEAFRNNVYEDLSKRLDLVFLDSVLQTEISLEDLPLEYRFMITDELGETVKFDNPPTNYSTKIDTTESHTTLLFPSNTLDEDLFIHVVFPKQKSFLFQEMWAPLLVNLALVVFIFIAMAYMFSTILTQRKLSELKSDFISNMTHEFKTPIATISLACEAMNDEDMSGNKTNSPYIKIVNDENKRLMMLVERILQSATLDKKDLRLKNESILLNELILDQVEAAKLRLKQVNGNISVDLPEGLVRVEGDRFHLANVISNLLDNAIKYSKGAPEINVVLKQDGKKVTLDIQDKGIGMKKEHLNKIFDKLYRIPTGNVHNVKGFGLGLSYVKAITELHGWSIIVKSKYGSGSTFIIEFKETTNG